MRLREASIFFNAYVSEDEKNVSRRLLHFDQGDLGIGSGTRDYYLNETLYGNYIAAYRKYQIEIIKLLVNGIILENICLSKMNLLRCQHKAVE